MGLLDKFKNNRNIDICTKEFLKTYEPSNNLKKPEAKILDWGKKMLPKEFIQLWIDYGFGNYGNGIIKIVDPREYMKNLYQWINEEDFNKIPIVITAFGDMFFYNKPENTISFLDIHNRQVTLCTDSYQEFFKKLIIDENIKLAVLRKNLFNQAKNKLGELTINEIYFFVPAFCLGGKEDIDNVDKGDARVHQDLLFQLGK